jgi:hypothetical protein
VASRAERRPRALPRTPIRALKKRKTKRSLDSNESNKRRRASVCVEQEDVEDDDDNDNSHEESLDEFCAFKDADEKITFKIMEKAQRKRLVQRCQEIGPEHWPYRGPSQRRRRSRCCHDSAGFDVCLFFHHSKISVVQSDRPDDPLYASICIRCIAFSC